MAVTLNPYINFRDGAREALTFYQTVFGGDLNVMTFTEGGMGDAVDASEADRIMHGQLDAPGITLMSADVPAHMGLADASNISISLSGPDDETLTGYYDKLADGGTVLEPLTAAPWGDKFGMLRDRFGVSWMVNITGAAPAAG